MGRRRRLQSLIAPWAVATLLLLMWVAPAKAEAPGTAIRYTYDPDGEITGLIVPSSESALYGWDPAGNLVSVSRESTGSLRFMQANPTSASVGETVALEGTGFSTTAKSNTVKFNGAAATVATASEWQLTVKVPSAATSGPITVQTPTEGPASSPEPFTVRSASGPTISKISPAKVAAGGTVTLSGSNFNASAYDDVLTVNRTKPEILSASPTSLKIAIPQATTGGQVSVETPEGSGAAKKPLYIAPPGIEVKSLGTTAEVATGKSKAIKLKGGKTSLALFDGVKGQRVSLTFTGATTNYGYASLYSPEATPLGSQGFDKSSTSTLEPVTLPSTGTYTVALEPSGKERGKVTLEPAVVNDVVGTLTPTPAGAKTNIKLITPGQQARYSVEAHAEESVSLETTKVTFGGSYTLEWLNPEGQVVLSRSFSGEEAGFLEQIKFPTRGTYTLVVNPHGQTGSLTLTAYEANDVTGTIAPSAEGETKTVAISIPGQYARYSFAGTKGQRVSLSLANSSFTNYVRVSIYGPEGEQLGSQYAYNGETTVLEPITLPTTATYTIWLEPYNGETGKLNLSAYTVADITGSISPSTTGTATAISFTTPGQQARYTVAGTAGGAVALEMTKIKLANSYSVEWLNPEGQTISSRSFPSGESAFMEQLRFPTTGSYTLVVNPHGQTGSLTLTAFDASDLVGTITPTSEGETTTVSIAVPGQYARYTFTGEQGQRVSLKLGALTFHNGVRASLYGPEEQQLASQYVYPEQSVVVEPVTLPSRGVYTIWLEPDNGETGKLNLSAYLVTDITGSVTPTTSGASTAVSVKQPGQQAHFSVAAKAGEAVSLETIKVKGLSSYSLEWFNPAGEYVYGQSFSGEANGFMGQLRFANTGIYTLTINPHGQTGSLTLVAYNASDVTGTITPTASGETKTITIGVPGQHARYGFPASAGQLVTFKATAVTISSGSLVAFEGEEEWLASTSLSSGASSALEVTPPTTAEDSVVVEPSGSDTGKLKLTAYLGSQANAIAEAASANAPPRLQVGKPASHRGDGLGKRAPDTAPPRRAVFGALRSPHVSSARRHAPRPRRVRQMLNVEPRARAAKAASATHGIDEATPEMLAFRPFRRTAWAPSARVRGPANGQSGELTTPWTRIARRLAGHDATAISGQVLATDGQPLAGVRISIAGSRAATATDAAGRFLLDEHVPAGQQRLVVEGERVGHASYGTYQIGVGVQAHTTTVLPYTVWLAPLDPGGNQRVPSPLRKEARLQTPAIPGLEVRIPAGTVITSPSGKTVHSLNITPIPVDRTPFPLPPFVEVPVYFTVQPGNAYLSKGAEIVYPNWGHAAPGQRIPFWNYDATKRGWYVYGYGTVTPDGKQVVPDPGVRIWEFSGAMITSSPPSPQARTKEPCLLDRRRASRSPDRPLRAKHQGSAPPRPDPDRHRTHLPTGRPELVHVRDRHDKPVRNPALVHQQLPRSRPRTTRRRNDPLRSDLSRNRVCRSSLRSNYHARSLLSLYDPLRHLASRLASRIDGWDHLRLWRGRSTAVDSRPVRQSHHPDPRRWADRQHYANHVIQRHVGQALLRRLTRQGSDRQRRTTCQIRVRKRPPHVRDRRCRACHKIQL